MKSSRADHYYIKALDQYPYNLEEAIENINYSLSYDEEHAAAHCLMGRLMMNEMKDYEAAHFHFERAIACNPHYPDIYVHFSQLLIRLRWYKKAQKLIDFAYTIRGIDRAKVKHQEALLNEVQQNFKAAKKCVKEALLNVYKNFEYDLLMGELHRIEDKMKRAKEKSKKAKNKKPPQF